MDNTLRELTSAEVDAVAGGQAGLGVLTAREAGAEAPAEEGFPGITNAAYRGGLGEQGNIPGEVGPGIGQATAGRTILDPL